jgi:AcrR family transcriptional regulator
MRKPISTVMKKKHPRGQRGLVEADLVEAALAEIERGGLEGFSLRCAARAIGCDAATLIYRFGSKEGLERAITERLHSEIQAPSEKQKWDKRLTDLARQYRSLAKSYPQAFPLLLRFWTSGPRDLMIAEHWHRALADAGIPEAQIPAVGCATYASVLGLCTGEVSGLLGLPSAQSLSEIKDLDQFTLTRRLLPIFEELGAETVFETALNLLIVGVKTTYENKHKISQPHPSFHKIKKSNRKKI